MNTIDLIEKKYALFIEIENPITYVEVEPHQGWRKTMAKDIESIKKN